MMMMTPSMHSSNSWVEHDDDDDDNGGDEWWLLSLLLLLLLAVGSASGAITSIGTDQAITPHHGR